MIIGRNINNFYHEIILQIVKNDICGRVATLQLRSDGTFSIIYTTLYAPPSLKASRGTYGKVGGRGHRPFIMYFRQQKLNFAGFGSRV